MSEAIFTQTRNCIRIRICGGLDRARSSEGTKQPKVVNELLFSEKTSMLGSLKVQKLKFLHMYSQRAAALAPAAVSRVLAGNG